jgi:hypothetical protein
LSLAKEKQRMKFGSVSLKVLMSMLAVSAVVSLASPAWAFRVPPRPTHGAPEIDPAGLAALSTLLVGGLAVARGRRRSS